MNAHTTIAPAPTLPAADAWHRNPLARQIVASMHECEALSRKLDETFGGDSGLATVWWRLGTIEDALDIKGSYARSRAHDGTVLDELADRLEIMRDEAIDAARLRAFPDSWHSHAEAYDAYFDELGEHLDTVRKALGGQYA